MTDEEIIDLVRDAGFDWHAGWTLDDDEPNRFVTLVNAVIKAHEAKLIDGVGEPFTHYRQYDDGCQDNPSKDTIPLYTATQVAGAVAKERAEYQASMDHQNAMARQRKERIATLESTLRVALEALKSCSGVSHWPALIPAIKEIKEVLHGSV